MIHGQFRPTIDDAIEVNSLGKIVRTLNDFPVEVTNQMNGKTVVLFTDGENVVLVSTGGYGYPRHKTPRIAIDTYFFMGDHALERLLKCKAVGDEVDYVIGGNKPDEVNCPCPVCAS